MRVGDYTLDNTHPIRGDTRPTSPRISQIPVPMTQALKHDGIIYRVSSDGSLHKVATGFINPIGVTFVDSHTLWITDINGDFIAGKRELPDGFIATIEPHY